MAFPRGMTTIQDVLLWQWPIPFILALWCLYCVMNGPYAEAHDPRDPYLTFLTLLGFFSLPCLVLDLLFFPFLIWH